MAKTDRRTPINLPVDATTKQELAKRIHTTATAHLLDAKLVVVSLVGAFGLFAAAVESVPRPQKKSGAG